MKFETNKKYSCRSACDSNCVWTFTVVKRTAKFVTLEDQDGEIIRKGVIVIDGIEKCKPLGNYSMAPVISSDREVQSEAVEVIEEVKSVDITKTVEAAEDTEYIEFEPEEIAFELQPEGAQKPTEAAEPHYVIQNSKETKKLGIFPSYKSALIWYNENSEKYKGMLGIYRVSIYDQEIKVKNFELVGGSFKEVEPEETIEETTPEMKVSNSKATEGCTMKKRVMPIRYRNINWSEPTSLKYVMAQRFRKNGYTHVLYRNKEYTCRTVKFDIIPNQNVFINFN